MIIVNNDYHSSHPHSKIQSKINSNEHNSGQTSSNKQQQMLTNKEFGTINDVESEFSLGQGTKNLIKFKAESILEQARTEFKSKKNNHNDGEDG